MKPSKSKPKRRDIQEVHLLDAKPNPMFPDWMTERLRFLRYRLPVKCAYCGRMNRHHWTMLLAFSIGEVFEEKIGDKVVERRSFGPAKDSRELYPPLTPVCRKHMMSPKIK